MASYKASAPHRVPTNQLIVVAAIERAAAWLAQAGCEVEAIEPRHFDEGAQPWRQLVMDDLRRGARPAPAALGDAGLRSAMRADMAGLPALDRDPTLDALTRRFNICRDGAVFLERSPVLRMPNSWQRQLPVDADRGPPAQVDRQVRAQSPLPGTAMMGRPGLSVPTGLANGLPTGVQLVSGRFREDHCLRAGGIIERAARFSALDNLVGPTD